MAVNLSVLKNPLKKALNPLGAITEQAPVTSQGPFSSAQDPLQSAMSHGKEIQSKIDEHVAQQSQPTGMPSIDFSSAINGQTAANQFMSGIKPTNPSPTGGGMMPPTSEAQPLPETPKAVSPKQDTGGFLDSIIPKVNAMSDDEIMKGINSGKYDDTINQLSKEGYGIEEITNALKDELASQSNESTNNTTSQSQQEPGFLQKLGESYLKPVQTIGEELVKKPVDRFLDFVQGRDLDPSNTYSGNDIWKTAGAGVQAGFNAALPGVSAGFNVAGSTNTGEKVLSSVPGQVGVGATLGGITGGKKGAVIGGIVGTIPGVTDFMLNNVPGLKDYYNSLDKEGQAGIQSTISGLAMVGAGALGAKSQGKTPTELTNELNKLPEDVAHNVVDAIKTMPETIKQRTADNAQKQVTKAKDILFEAVNPTTRENKAVLNKRVEDLVPFLENNPMKNSLEDVKSRVDTQKDTAGKNMETYENDVGVKGTVKTSDIAEKLKSKFMEKIGKSFINPDEAKIASELIKTLQGFGETVDGPNIIKVRRAWDQIEKKNKGFMMSAEATSKGDIFGEANKFFRDEIRKSNPEYAQYLDNYHKTATLSDVLGATIERRVGQQKGGFIKRGFDVGARITGAGLGGLPGYLASEALIQGSKYLASPEFKLTRGKKMLEKGQAKLNKLNPQENGLDSNAGNVTSDSMVGGESLGSTTKKFPINLAEEKAKTGLSGLKSTVTKQTNATPIPETLVKPRSTPVSDTKVDKEPIISKSKDIPKKTIGKTEPSIIDNANKNPLRIESFNKDEIKPILDTINRYSVKSPQEFERIIKDYVMKYKNRIELLDHQKDFLQALRNPLFSKNSPDEIYNLVKQTDTKVNPFDLSKNKKGMISPKAIGESVGIGKVPDGTMKSPGFNKSKPFGLTTQEGDLISKYSNWGYKGGTDSITLDKAIEKIPNSSGLTFRGDNIKDFSKFEKGKVVSFGKPLSSSYKSDIADNFKGNTVFTIDGVTGKDISMLSDVSGEGEVLFGSKSKFKVKSVYKSKDGITNIELSQVE